MRPNIDKKAYDHVLFRCECGCDNFLEFAKHPDEGRDEFWCEVISYPPTLLKLIVNWFKYGRRINYSELMLTRSDLKKLKEFLEEYLSN